MTEKAKEYNNKWLLSKYLMLTLEEINKMTNHEINTMVKHISEDLKK